MKELDVRNHPQREARAVRPLEFLARGDRHVRIRAVDAGFQILHHFCNEGYRMKPIYRQRRGMAEHRLHLEVSEPATAFPAPDSASQQLRDYAPVSALLRYLRRAGVHEYVTSSSDAALARPETIISSSAERDEPRGNSAHRLTTASRSPSLGIVVKPAASAHVDLPLHCDTLSTKLRRKSERRAGFNLRRVMTIALHRSAARHHRHGRVLTISLLPNHRQSLPGEVWASACIGINPVDTVRRNANVAAHSF